MGVRENKVEKYLDTEVKKNGGITRKWVSPGRDGVTDRIVFASTTVAEMIKKLMEMHPDKVIADIYLVEVKTVDGKLSKNQEREHKRLLKTGAEVFTVYGEQGIDAWVREVMLK